MGREIEKDLRRHSRLGAVRRRTIDDRFERGPAKAGHPTRTGADGRVTFDRKNKNPREDDRVFGHGNVVERNGPPITDQDPEVEQVRGAATSTK